MDKEDIERAIEDCEQKIAEYKADYKCWIKECNIEETKLEALKRQLNDGWIPVSERLPDPKDMDNIHSIVTYNRILFSGRRSRDTKIARYNGSEWISDGGVLDVVAWQPVPKRYEK